MHYLYSFNSYHFFNTQFSFSVSKMTRIGLIFCATFAILSNGVLAQSCLEINIDYVGSNINNGLEQRTDHAEDCQKLCQVTFECEGFTWASPNFPGSKTF
jgi:hypothetical protein